MVYKKIKQVFQKLKQDKVREQGTKKESEVSKCYLTNPCCRTDCRVWLDPLMSTTVIDMALPKEPE